VYLVFWNDANSSSDCGPSYVEPALVKDLSEVAAKIRAGRVTPGSTAERPAWMLSVRSERIQKRRGDSCQA